MTFRRLWDRFYFQLGKFVFRSRYEREMSEELHLHLQRDADAQVAAGMPLDEAEFAASKKFGNVGVLQDECRSVRQFAAFENFRRDLRYGLRALGRTPTFTAVAILSLALGIGANTAIFTVVHAFLLTTLPVSSPQRLALLRIDRPTAMLNGLIGKESYTFSYQLFERLRQHTSTFSGLLATGGHDFLQRTQDGSRLVPGQLVSGEYFRTLGVRPQAGRLLDPADDRRGGGASGLVAVISDGFWTRSFGRDPHAIGKSIRLDGQSVLIVGVLPPGFRGVFVGENPDIFAPLEAEPVLSAPFSSVTCESCTWLTVIARVKDGDNLVRLNAKLSAISGNILADLPTGSFWGNTREEVRKIKLGAAPGSTGYTYLRQRFSHPLRVLMILALLVLLTACANLTSLLLARSAVREREFLLRGALGASRGRLITQIMTETLLVAVAGTLAGVPLAYALSKFLALSLFTGSESFQLALSASPSIIFFMAGIMLLSCFGVGLAPALRLTRPSAALMSGTRIIFSENGRRWVPRTLLVGQVGLSLVLVTGAMLFSGTLFRLRQVPLGFNPDRLMAVRSSWEKSKKSDDERLSLLRQALEQVRSSPGVASAALAGIVPLSGNARFDHVSMPGSSQKLDVWKNLVSPGYFATMQTRILEGRDFRDNPEDRKSAVILPRNIARKLFPGRSAVGQSIYDGSLKGESKRVVGVVEDNKYLTVRDNQSTVFTLNDAWCSTFLIRYSGNAGSILTRVAGVLRRTAGDVPLETPLAMDKLLDRTLATERLLAVLGDFFGALALLLMAIGLYGTLAYVTSRRTPEIGVRMALGANVRSVVWTVTRENLLVTALGAAIGFSVLGVGLRYIQSFLYGVEMFDPAVLLIATGTIGLVAAIATGFPALRAARIEPMKALRSE